MTHLTAVGPPRRRQPFGIHRAAEGDGTACGVLTDAQGHVSSALRQNDPTAMAFVAGRYTLFGAIGSGGMATVHLARRVDATEPARTVAVKRLHAHLLQDPELPLMFADEARLAARVHHPNVVPTLEVLAVEGELFLVMEYLPGETLARLARETIRRGATVPLGIASAIVVGMLLGLEAAHHATDERGRPLDLVHRDVSPQNVLVGVDGHARLLDFGVAKASGRSRTTKEGQLRGKVAYMAPEQLGGEATRATDVYATAAVLWEVLAGRPLFTADSDAMLLACVAMGNVVAPSVHRAEVPPQLDAVVLRGLSRDPALRFGSASEMAQALAAAVPPAAASAVAAWVQDTAAQALAERARAVAAVEAALPAEPDDLSTPTLVPTSGSARPPRPPRRGRAAMALGAFALVGALGTLAMLRAPLRAPPAAPPPVAAAQAAPIAATARPAPEPEAPAPASAPIAPPTATSPVATAPRSTTRGPRRPRAAAPAASVVPSPAPEALPSCDPPYVIDPESGDRRYKRECLK
jgi:eukaryotic-like serine/threonine-protein kinase